MRLISVPQTNDSQRQLIWRSARTRFPPCNVMERNRYGGHGVVVWGGILLNGRTELHVFDRSSVTEDRYCKKVILPHVRLFRGAIRPYFIFMDDNTRRHQTVDVQWLLESEGITRRDSPAFSSDLNLKTVCGMLWVDSLWHDYILWGTPNN
ncbi:transposable element Tcb1 transposase [Trichonephila clavipes]|nr:transposable element Tcb1 transposase [Trichonephila clavipes]